MKKLLLGLGTLSLAALPVVALVSCSSETQKTVMKGSLNRGAVIAANITTTIAAIKVYEGKTTPTTSDKNILIAALNTTSFSGLLVTDLPNYKITYTETDGSETITLTANSGFTFELGTKLISKAKDADVEMKGSLKNGVTSVNITTTIAAIKVYEGKKTPTTSDKDNLITALNKTSFTGLLATDIPNYVISYIETGGSETITLTANSGFTFELGTKLISKAIIIISGAIKQTVYTADINTTIDAIKTYKEITSPNSNEQDTLITALNKTSFKDLVKEDLPLYEITVGKTTSGLESITLEMKEPGYSFGAGPKLLSEATFVLPITIPTGPVTTDQMKATIRAIEIWKGDNTQLGNLVTSLNTATFLGITIANFSNFTITYDDSTDGSETITLTVKTGYEFASAVLKLTSTVKA